MEKVEDEDCGMLLERLENVPGFEEINSGHS
jgi:hypothetical protein